MRTVLGFTSTIPPPRGVGRWCANPVDKRQAWEEAPGKRRGPRGVAVLAQGKVHLMMIARVAAVIGLAACPILVGSSASASPPIHEVTHSDEYGEGTFDCSEFGDFDFEVHIAGTYSQRFTYFFDADGNLTRINEYVSAPHDVFTNTTSGESIVVRGYFVQVMTRVPGTDEFDRTITGFRYMVNEPGEGVIVQEVGRIVYDNFDETTWHDVAGQHDLADVRLNESTMCAALA
jgi:hypothetical protein